MIAVAMISAFLAVWCGMGPRAGLRLVARPAAGKHAVPDRHRRTLLVVLCCTGSAAGWMFLGPMGAVVGAAVGGIGGHLVLSHLEPADARRHRVALSRELPLTLDLIAACLDAGSPLRTACATVQLVGPPVAAADLALVSARVHVGMSEEEAWRPLLEISAWKEPVRDIIRCLGTGAALGEVLREHAAQAREDHHAACQEAARAVGVKTVLPLMCCFLPAFLLVGVVPVVAGLVGSVFQH